MTDHKTHHQSDNQAHQQDNNQSDNKRHPWIALGGALAALVIIQAVQVFM